jgi:hypothetical protein
MSELLQVQQAVDEEAVRRFGPDFEDSIRQSSYRALAEEMIKSRSVTEKIIDPDADEASEHGRYRMRRYYRYSVLVGGSPDAQALVDARAAGQAEALSALKSMLAKPNDYEGELRGYLLRYLDQVRPEDIAFEAAAIRSAQ